jgi:starch synthase
MRIAIAASEAVPFSKTGGLADVAGTLFREFLAMGHEALLFLPLYKKTAEHFAGTIQDSGVEIGVPLGNSVRTCKVFTSIVAGSSPNVFFIGNNEFFFREELYGTSEGDYHDNDRRFVFFSRSILDICRKLELEIDIIQCNDWQTGLIPLYMKTIDGYKRFFEKTASVLTIHNLGYQGLFPRSTLEITGLSSALFQPEGIEFYGKINFLKAGIVGADVITTVSKTYAEEIVTPESGFGLDGILRKRRSSLAGILNGLDTRDWDPSSDKFIVRNYDKSNLQGKQSCKEQLIKAASLNSSASDPLMCFIARLSSQKGLDLLEEAIPSLLSQGARIIVIGKGDMSYQARLDSMSKRVRDHFFFHAGFDETLARLTYAGSDMFLMPSKYEPCGLGQMIAMRYGTLPVAHKTGGLSDTIEDGKTGFLFREFNLPSFMDALSRAMKAFHDKETWMQMIGNAMDKDFSWKKSAREYIAIYQNALQ